MTKVRGLFGNLVDEVEIHLDSSLMGNGGQVQHRVGATAKSHVGGKSIFKGLLIHDLAGGNAFFQHFHNSHTSVLGQGDSGARNSGDGSVTR